MQSVNYFRTLFLMTVFGLFFATGQAAVAQQLAQGRAYCGKDGNNPTTVMDNGSRSIGLIRWIRSFAPNSEWSPQARCEQVSKKLAQNQDSRNLVEIVPAKANGLRVLCASPTKVNTANYSCPDAQILLTLRPKDPSPNDFIRRIYEINTGKSSEALETGNAISERNGVVNLNFVRFVRLARSVDSDRSEESTTPSCSTAMFGGCSP